MWLDFFEGKNKGGKQMITTLIMYFICQGNPKEVFEHIKIFNSPQEAVSYSDKFIIKHPECDLTNEELRYVHFYSERNVRLVVPWKDKK